MELGGLCCVPDFRVPPRSVGYAARLSCPRATRQTPGVRKLRSGQGRHLQNAYLRPSNAPRRMWSPAAELGQDRAGYCRWWLCNFLQHGYRRGHSTDQRQHLTEISPDSGQCVLSKRQVTDSIGHPMKTDMCLQSAGAPVEGTRLAYGTAELEPSTCPPVATGL